MKYSPISVVIIFGLLIFLFVFFRKVFFDKCKYLKKPICEGELSCSDSGKWKCTFDYNTNKKPSDIVNIGCTTFNKPRNCAYPVCIGGKWKCLNKCKESTRPLPSECSRSTCVNGKWVCLDYTRPDICEQNKKPKGGCPDGTELVCYNGMWSCSSSCDYIPTSECKTGYDNVCVNGSWECVIGSCDPTPGAAPICPEYTNLVCSEGTWLCDGCDPSLYDNSGNCDVQTCINGQWKCETYKDYVGGVLNSNPFFDTNGGMKYILAANDCNVRVVNTCFVNNGNVPVVFSKKINPGNSLVGFNVTKLRNSYIVEKQNPTQYYTEFLWDLKSNPYPLFNLDLFVGQCENIISSDNYAMFYLTIFNSREGAYNTNGDYINTPIARCSLYNDTIGNIVDKCGTTANTGGYLLENENVPMTGSGEGWTFLQDISGIDIIYVGFSIGMYSKAPAGTDAKLPFDVTLYNSTENSYSMKILKGPTTNNF